MKFLLVAAAVGSALVAGGVLMSGEFNVARVDSPRSAGSGGAVQQAAATERTAKLQVSNMYCVSCPYIVQRALRSVPGVIDASVSLGDRQAVVRFDATKTGIADLLNVTRAIGYPARVVSN